MIILPMIEREFISTSLRQTHHLGRKIGSQLKAGDTIALCGELGAGKTSLAQGIARGLGVDSHTPVTSPTFTIVNQYEGRVPIYHIDFYRIGSASEFYLTGLEEFFTDNAVAIIEWADKYPDTLALNTVWVYVQFMDNKTRKIIIKSRPEYMGELHVKG